MTETDTDTTTETGGQTDAGAGADAGQSGAGSTYERVRRLADYLLLFGLGLVVLVAGIQTYTAVDTVIRRFVTDEFQPLVRGGFNLALLLAAAAGVGLQLRRLR
jgi:hypothetical protein